MDNTLDCLTVSVIKMALSSVWPPLGLQTASGKVTHETAQKMNSMGASLLCLWGGDTNRSDPSALAKAGLAPELQVHSENPSLFPAVSQGQPCGSRERIDHFASGAPIRY